jgi:hypothetical protein
MRQFVTTSVQQQIDHLAGLDGVSKVLPPRTDLVRKAQSPGVYFEPKGQTDFYLRQNQIPLYIIDTDQTGRCFVIVCAKPGRYDAVRELIDDYQADGSGKGLVRKDPIVMEHISNIRSLEEVARVEPGKIRKTETFPPGVYQVARTNGTVFCTAVGSAAGLGLGVCAYARQGRSADLEWMLNNYQDIFKKV